MTGNVLLGPNGKPISSADFSNKKARPPALGERYGQWAGDNVPLFTLPGGGAIAFDPTQLTLADFRQMKGHYQINSSLSVLTFMMHQTEWHIESENKKVAEDVERNLREVWSRLVRAKSQALWAGYSPNALEWENDIDGRAIVLNKVKDLFPEECRVNWKTIDATVPSDAPGMPPRKVQHKVYDGIKQWGAPDIPVANSYWYPLLMENGNYYGRRLLESAFQPWFFSTLMHLFANRYYERFGEPVPVGRAPYEEDITVGGKTMMGNELMALVLQQIRNRSVAILPNDRTPSGDETNPSFDYQIEYLESQMRGADFERYMTRLDEEMSLAMFTPILMMRTADVGSYNLGTQHTQVYQWMLNAITGDWAHYINKFIIRPMVAYNSNRSRPPRTQIKFAPMGKMKPELLQSIVTALINKDKIKPDTREIGEMAGLTFEEIEEVTGETEAPPAEEPVPPAEEGESESDNVVKLIKKRVRDQATKAFKKGEFNGILMGYRRQFSNALRRDGYANPDRRVDDFYEAMDRRLETLTDLGVDEYSNVDTFMRVFEIQVDNLVTSIRR